MTELPHEIVTIVGTTGSGKTALIAEHIGPRHARRITCDLVGECRKLYPDAIHLTAFAQLFPVLRRLNDHGVDRWHIVAQFTVAEIGKLITALVPTGPDASRSLSLAWGGLALEIFELDLVAPVDRSEEATRLAVKTAYARGRHFGLSILAATQRPHMIDRIATAQSTYVVTFQMHEPHDLAFLKRCGGSAFAELARTGLRQYESAWYATRLGELYVLSADRETMRRIGGTRPGDLRD